MGSACFDGGGADRFGADAAWQGSRHGRGIWHRLGRKSVGSSGSANFLSRSTAVAAAVFFITSLSLTYLYAHPAQQQGVMDKVNPVATQAAPVAPAPAASAATAADVSKSSEIPK